MASASAHTMAEEMAERWCGGGGAAPFLITFASVSYRVLFRDILSVFHWNIVIPGAQMLSQYIPYDIPGIHME